MAGLPVKNRWSNGSLANAAPASGPPRKAASSHSSKDSLALDDRRHLGDEFRELQHASVACGENSHERTEREVDREIPGHDIADHAQRLRVYVRPRPELRA